MFIVTQTLCYCHTHGLNIYQTGEIGSSVVVRTLRLTNTQIHEDKDNKHTRYTNNDIIICVLFLVFKINILLLFTTVSIVCT